MNGKYRILLAIKLRLPPASYRVLTKRSTYSCNCFASPRDTTRCQVVSVDSSWVNIQESHLARIIAIINLMQIKMQKYDVVSRIDATEPITKENTANLFTEERRLFLSSNAAEYRAAKMRAEFRG